MINDFMKKNICLYVLFSISIALNIVSIIYISIQNSSQEIYNNSIKKVVELRASNEDESYSYGTGFFISPTKIVTNKHVILDGIEPFSLIEFRFVDSDEFLRIKDVVNVYEDNDLAVLSTEKRNSNYFNIGQSKLGETVFSFGNTNGDGIQFASGVISSYSMIQYNRMNISMIGTSILIDVGMSGGALVNDGGMLIGILTLRIRGDDNNPIYSISYSINLGALTFSL